MTISLYEEKIEQNFKNSWEKSTKIKEANKNKSGRISESAWD
jgi:hypothetical protein